MKAKNGNGGGTRVLAVLAMVASLQGCESGLTRAESGESEAAQTASLHARSVEDVPAWLQPGQAIIRQRNDPARGRLWVLTRDGVDVYDALQKHKLAHIGIPGWHLLRESYACAPDFALGPKGEVVITSNIMTTLWRVDPESLSITRHEIAVEPATQKDFGFTSLTYSSARGAYYGVGAFDALVWRIDPQLRVAHEPVPGVASARVCGAA